MADMHVLAGNGLYIWTLIMHFPVPNADNEIGVNYRTALINSGLGGTAMTEGAGPGQISTAEKAQIDAGEIYEHSIQFLAESGADTLPELLAAAREAYAREKSRVTARFAKQLRYYGLEGSAE